MVNKFIIKKFEKEFQNLEKQKEIEKINLDKDTILEIQNKNYEINVIENLNLIIENTSNKEVNTNIIINIKKNKKINLVEFSNNNNQSTVLEINLDKKAQCNHQKIILNNKVNKNISNLKQESKYYLDTCIYTDKKNESYNESNSILLEKESISSLNINTVSKNESLIVNDGLIQINEKGEGCQGLMELKNLIIDNSKIHSIPNLKVNNNKVKCSHGCSISNIDNENYFYLTSRGFNKKQIQDLIINSYFEKIINKIPKSLKQKIIDYL